MRTRPLAMVLAGMLVFGLGCSQLPELPELPIGGKDEPKPEKTSPAKKTSSLSEALAGLQSGKTPDAKPKEGSPPRGPRNVEETTPPEPSAEEPAAPRADPGSAQCQAARAERTRLEAKVERQREVSVVSAERSANAAQAAMTACMSSIECTSDGEKLADTQKRVGTTQEAYSRALEQIGYLEAGYFEIDRSIKRECGG